MIKRLAIVLGLCGVSYFGVQHLTFKTPEAQAGWCQASGNWVATSCGSCQGDSWTGDNCETYCPDGYCQCLTYHDDACDY